MSSSSPGPATLAEAAARLRAALTVLIVFLGFALAAERLGYAGLYRGPAVSLAGLAPAIAGQLVLAAPAALYLAALWQLRQVAAAVAQGAVFGVAVVQALRRVGVCLIGGATLSLIAMPILHRVLGQAYPRLIDFDVATLVIGGIGIGLVFLARLIDRAGAVQSELDDIF